MEESTKKNVQQDLLEAEEDQPEGEHLLDLRHNFLCDIDVMMGMAPTVTLKIIDMKQREESSLITERILNSILEENVEKYITQHLDIILDYLYSKLSDKERERLLDFIEDKCPNLFPVLENILDCIIVNEIERKDLKMILKELPL